MVCESVDPSEQLVRCSVTAVVLLIIWHTIVPSVPSLIPRSV